MLQMVYLHLEGIFVRTFQRVPGSDLGSGSLPGPFSAGSDASFYAAWNGAASSQLSPGAAPAAARASGPHTRSIGNSTCAVTPHRGQGESLVPLYTRESVSLSLSEWFPGTTRSML